MTGNVLPALIKYVKDTSKLTLLTHVGLLLITITWTGIVYVGSTNFDTLLDIYQGRNDANKIEIKAALDVSQQVNTLITDQRIRLDVDRLYVSKFHNGKVDLNGIHFIYTSRIAESAGSGISNEITRTQNLPLSIFPEMINAISADKCYYVEKVDNSVANAAFLETMGVQSMMICPINNSNGSLIGLIGADGVANPINKDRATELETSMTTVSGVLGSLLIQ